jgi:hypothetical protein
MNDKEPEFSELITPGMSGERTNPLPSKRRGVCGNWVLKYGKRLALNAGHLGHLESVHDTR